MPAKTPQRAQDGFTLLELMITIVVVAILAGFALPSMSNVILKHRVQDAASALYATLFKARSEALRLADNVKVQPNSSSTTSTDWAGLGWKITHFNSVASATEVLDVHPPVQKATSGQERGMTITLTGTSPIVYGATGRVTSASAPSFQISATNGSFSCTYNVTVDPSGRPYQSISSASTGTNVATGLRGTPSC